MERSGLEKNQVEKDLDIFLREMQSKYGEKSVIFVGFFPYRLTNISGIHAKISDLFWNQLLAYGPRLYR